jgi:hypothetical protein
MTESIDYSCSGLEEFFDLGLEGRLTQEKTWLETPLFVPDFKG